VCAELILPQATRCRFCGHVLGTAAQADEERRLNLAGLSGLVLALLAWPAVGIAFFFVFKQVIQSLIVGVAVSAPGLALAVTGIVLASRKSRRTGGMGMSVAALIVALFGVASFTAYAMLAREAADMMPQSASAVRQLLGTEKPHVVPMKCAACGHEFEMSAMDLLMKQSTGVVGLLDAGADINALLDKVEKQPVPEHKCPHCGRTKARPMVLCPKCAKRFLPDLKGAAGPHEVVCPYCGTRIPYTPTRMLKGLALDGNG